MKSLHLMPNLSTFRPNLSTFHPNLSTFRPNLSTFRTPNPLWNKGLLTQ